MIHLKAYATALTIFALAGMLVACSPATKTKSSLSLPMTCSVDLTSEEGGRLEVTKREPDPTLPLPLPPLQIIWHPPTLGSSVDLVIGYNGSSLEKLSYPSGGHVRFTPRGGLGGGHYKALMTSGSAQIWLFGSTDVGIESTDVGVSPKFADVTFSTDQPDGAAVMTAIDKGQHIRIVLLNEDKLVVSATFNTSATTGRDKLLAQARHLVETSDPSVCWRPRPTWPTQ